jgi:CheY-like chemotaxis protein
MAHETILYVFDSGTDSNAALAVLRAAGYEVVSTNSAMQAIALLYILHPIGAVVLDRRAPELTSFDVARSLKAVRPDVPIVLLCRDQFDHLPPSVDGCVSTRQPLAKLTSEVRSLLTSRRSQYAAHDADPDASACLRESQGAATTTTISGDPEPLRFQPPQGQVNS